MLSLILLTACAHPPPAAASTATAPPADPGDGDEARARFATGFVEALVRGDDAAIAPYVDPARTCEALARPGQGPELLAACADELASVNAQGVSELRAHLPAGFEVGAATVTPINDRVFVVNVASARGEASDVVPVLILEQDGHRFVAFARRKE